MLGHRGCRLGISYPEITEMQAQAIFEATAELIKEGAAPFPEVMVPLVGSVNEFRHQKQIIEDVAETVQNEMEIKFDYLILCWFITISLLFSISNSQESYSCLITLSFFWSISF